MIDLGTNNRTAKVIRVAIVSVAPVVASCFRPTLPHFSILSSGLLVQLEINGLPRQVVAEAHGVEPVRDAIRCGLGHELTNRQALRLATIINRLDVDAGLLARVEYRVCSHEQRFRRWYEMRTARGYSREQIELVDCVRRAERCAAAAMRNPTRRADQRLLSFALEVLGDYAEGDLPHLSPVRVRVLLPSLLRLLVHDVQDFVASGDWTWHDPEDPCCCPNGECPPMVDNEHPSRLLARVEAAQRIAEGVVAVTEVMMG